MHIPDFVKFECQPDCSACCRIGEGKVYLTENEAQRIAAFFTISERDFLERFTSVEEDRFLLKDKEDQTCVFLRHPLCQIYEVRPLQCRTYPFWSENLKNRNRWDLTRKECPGIGKGRTFLSNEIKQILNGKSLDSDK